MSSQRRQPAQRSKARQGPFVSALICERVLAERDGTISAIRIIDQLTFERPNTQEAGAIVLPIPARLALLVIVKAHPVPGKHALRVEARTPTGDVRKLGINEIEMTKSEREGLAGANLVANVDLAVTEAGFYWFDVYLDDKFTTSTPLRVVHAASARRT